MKKEFIFLVVATTLLTMTSCKKWYNCKCSTSGGATLWQGEVEATSKAKAEKILQDDNCGDVTTCD